MTQRRSRQRGARVIRNERVLETLTLAQEQARGKALHVLSLMRTHDKSLTQAAQELGIHPSSVRAWVGPILTKQGRYWKARPRDTLVRVLRINTARGVKEVAFYDSRTASAYAAYAAAVGRALRGDVAALRPFRGQTFRTGKVTYPYLTNLAVLKRLAHASELPEYSLYASQS